MVESSEMYGAITVFAIVIFCHVIVFFATGIWRRTSIGKKLLLNKKRSPISDKILRTPGESLRNRERTVSLDFAFYVGTISLPMFVIYAILVSEKNLHFATQFILIATGLSVFVIYLLRIRKTVKDLHSIWLGLDGEMATAQELNQLMLDGYHVYHDFPADNFNIDHIVIGPAGVFAVETKARPKPRAKGLQSAKVSFDGNILRFPDGQDSKFIKQAREQAEWLTDFLRKSVGKPIQVSPILALPGWMVNRYTAIESPLVVNPKEAVKIIPKRADILYAQTIQQIKFQVEQRCRTVEPYEPVL